LTQIKRFRKVIINDSFVELINFSTILWDIIEFCCASVICQCLTLFKCLANCASIASVENRSCCFLRINGVFSTCFNIRHYLLVKVAWNHFLSSYRVVLWLLWRNCLNCLWIRMRRYFLNLWGLQAVVFPSLLGIRSSFDWSFNAISSFTNFIVDFISVTFSAFRWGPTNWYRSSWTSFIDWFVCKAKFKYKFLTLVSAASQTLLLWLFATCKSRSNAISLISYLYIRLSFNTLAIRRMCIGLFFWFGVSRPCSLKLGWLLSHHRVGVCEHCNFFQQWFLLS
jgi:hypothetical protein